jgi:hypothetical protein
MRRSCSVRALQFTTAFKERTMNFRRLHLSFTEQRRKKLRAKPGVLRCESRTTITEPISFFGLALSAIRPMLQLGFMYPDGAGSGLRSLARAKEAAKLAGHSSPKPYVIPAKLLKSIDDIAIGQFAGGSSPGAGAHAGSTAERAGGDSANDWLTFNTPAASNASDTDGISAPWHPAKGPGGGAAQAPRGGTSAARGIPPAARGAVTPLRLPSNTASASTGGGASAALLAAVAGASGAGGQNASAGMGTDGSAAAAPRASLVQGGSGAPAGQSGSVTVRPIHPMRAW